jgi:hypothetical protein
MNSAVPQQLMKPESGGGLLLLRRITPLKRRHTVYFCSGAYRSTCGSDVQLAMTLSHELQHFLQFVTDRRLWAIHTLLTKLPNLPTHNLKHWFDLPNEKEARIIAKRIAENLFGRAVVDQHIVKMMAARISEEDAADWEFIQKIDPSRNYDLRQNTIPLVIEYRQELEKLRTQFAGDTDLGAADLDL